VRLFLAVDVDRATREAADRLRAMLRRERPTVERALRWVEPECLHVTVRFLGERDDLDALARGLSVPFAQPRFELEWSSPAWLPPHGRARVFHVAIGSGMDALSRLAAEVTARLAAIGIPPEDRPFTGHLTLARVRDSAEPGVARQIRSLVPVQPFLPGTSVAIDAVTLYESRLSPKGPTYHAHLRQKLALM
jgi:2'-5' RNA ligase